MPRIKAETSSFPIMSSQFGEAFLQSISASNLHFHFPFTILVSPQIFPLNSVVERTRALESGRPGLRLPLCPLWTKRPWESSFLFLSLRVICRWGQVYPAYCRLGWSNEQVCVWHLTHAGTPASVVTTPRQVHGCPLWGNFPGVSHVLGRTWCAISH